MPSGPPQPLCPGAQVQEFEVHCQHLRQLPLPGTGAVGSVGWAGGLVAIGGTVRVGACSWVRLLT